MISHQWIQLFRASPVAFLHPKDKQTGPIKDTCKKIWIWLRRRADKEDRSQLWDFLRGIQLYLCLSVCVREYVFVCVFQENFDQTKKLSAMKIKHYGAMCSSDSWRFCWSQGEQTHPWSASVKYLNLVQSSWEQQTVQPVSSFHQTADFTWKVYLL